MEDPVSSGRPASSLNTVTNDTGRVAFCGPYVLSAITGYGISRIEDVIRAGRDVPEGKKPIVRGTYADEVEAALAHFGYRMLLKESFLHKARKERPSVWTWMQKPRNAWAYYILAIHKGKEGHWILVKGVKMCDTFTEGKWTFVVDRPASRLPHHGSVRGQEIHRRLSVRRPRARMRPAHVHHSRKPGSDGPGFFMQLS